MKIFYFFMIILSGIIYFGNEIYIFLHKHIMGEMVIVSIFLIMIMGAINSNRRTSLSVEISGNSNPILYNITDSIISNHYGNINPMLKEAFFQSDKYRWMLQNNKDTTEINSDLEKLIISNFESFKANL